MLRVFESQWSDFGACTVDDEAGTRLRRIAESFAPASSVHTCVAMDPSLSRVRRGNPVQRR